MQKKINFLCVIADSHIPFFYELNDISPLPDSKKKQRVQIFQLYGLLLFDIRLLMVLFFHFVTKQISSTCDLQV